VKKRRLLFFLAVILVVEAAVVLAAPGRIPRFARILTAATNVIAAAAIWLLSRQAGADR
jgi:hypothetical protein